MATYGMIEKGTGGTAAAAKTQIGSNLILPAGGPYVIHDVHAIACKVTTVPNEGNGGQLIVDSYSGDISPDPAPGTYPISGSPANVSANDGLACKPVDMWRVNWEASGKAAIQLFYLNILAITTGSSVVAGIIFGDAIPEKRPLVFCDGVYGSFASAAETSIGAITLAEKATRIVGIMAELNHGDAVTIAEPTAGYIRLTSNDVDLNPGMFPCSRGFDAADGTPVGACSIPKSEFIPVDIPVPGGATINVLGTTTVSVTGNADFSVFIAYE